VGSRAAFQHGHCGDGVAEFNHHDAFPVGSLLLDPRGFRIICPIKMWTHRKCVALVQVDGDQ
jgi:hypothetical protein